MHRLFIQAPKSDYAGNLTTHFRILLYQTKNQYCCIILKYAKRPNSYIRSPDKV